MEMVWTKDKMKTVMIHEALEGSIASGETEKRILTWTARLRGTLCLLLGMLWVHRNF